jgi:predicted nucleic acid-binding Zn ribbon protein
MNDNFGTVINFEARDSETVTKNCELRTKTMGEYSLGDAMKYFLNHSRLKGSIQALQIEDVWEQIMGKTIAKYTDKIQIQGKTLYITTSMAPLKQELLYQKDNILKRVNETLGENVIKDVVIQ